MPIQKIASKSAVIGVVGLGYVGLPLILAYIRAGFHVIGFDIDSSKIAALGEGRSYIKHIPIEQVAAAQASGRLSATADFSRVAEVDSIIICVPTPLDQHFEPDLSYVRDTLDAVCPHLKPGTILTDGPKSGSGDRTGRLVKSRKLPPKREILFENGWKSGCVEIPVFSTSRLNTAHRRSPKNCRMPSPMHTSPNSLKNGWKAKNRHRAS